MNTIKLGWIDYSSDHKSKVMAVLDLLSDKGAIDELGIGLVRDGFADVLFPGTSTLQTRAKYFFIIPYLMMGLEREKHSSPGEFLEKLGAMEVDLIETLVKKSAEGVIGARAGKKLKRKPSSVYWSGLKTFEIFNHDLTLNNYAKAVFRIQRNKESIRSLGNEDSDDLDTAASEYTSTYWQCLIPESDWKEKLTMDLTFNEAVFLKERMVKSRKSEDSLLAFLLQQNPWELEKIDDFDAIGEVFSLPEGGLREDYAMAKKFSKFIAGANIRYNVILSNKENEIAVQKWNQWRESSFVKNEFPYFRYQDVLYRLKINNPLLKRFLSEWQKTALSDDETVIDELLVQREIELKSKDRAKLYNTKFYAYEEGIWLGSEKLQYRFPNCQNLMVDIFAGLEGGHA
ncbi:DUF6361 family protein [Alkalihalobacillus sp. AL-G]|uniref:DUF6361 family protein n=1 Tax=Alkalihalobacillus sp. AL-G TaxID=2926399 RepID=UPI00272D5371|nr:DUF6361 family protein [Alkalihalobacillus sp. AL-G]WLD94463.1 DUF6361 family protein [Alkalihalobacillus sp. AL-G]